jgi:hypothetical protein
MERLARVEHDAIQFERAMRLRAHAQRILDLGQGPAHELREQAQWIRHAADWLDPFVSRSWEGAEEVVASDK